MSTYISATTIFVGYDSQNVGVTGVSPAPIPITTLNYTVGPGAVTTSIAQQLYVPSKDEIYTTATETTTVSGFATIIIVTRTSTSTTWIPTILEVPLVTFPPSIPTSSSNSTTSVVFNNSAPASRLSSSTISGSVVPAATSSAGFPQTSTSGSKFTSADLVGAAIGCLIGGALIASLLVWLFLSSRHRRQRFQGGLTNDQQSSSNVDHEKPLPTAPLLAARGAGAGVGWEQHLPQSESDSTIRMSVKALFDQIELHVENFYRDASVSIDSGMQSELMKVDSNHLPDSVVGLLPQTKTPTMLIKHCLAHLIVSRITVDTDTPASFLPADFVALPRTIGGTKANTNKPAFAQALSRWRVLSYYLRPRAKDDNAYLSLRDRNITRAADEFCSAFAPWARSLNDLDARRRNLIEIMKSAADTGIMIFSQPSSFTYRWATPNERDGKGRMRIVVVPGFAKVCDEHARQLPGAGQELVAPVVGTL